MPNEPYYKDEWCTIYHGDCREILPEIKDVALVLADPPYGIKLGTDYTSRGIYGYKYDKITGDDKDFDPSFLLEYKSIIWGANYFCKKLPKSGGWIVWDKRVYNINNDQADCELAFTNFVKGARIFRHMWDGYKRDSEKGEHYHPAQKPVALMSWCLNLKWTPPGLVVDPYMGSGPVLRAAKNNGRQAIGIEMEEKYCEIAAMRLSQEVLQI